MYMTDLLSQNFLSHNNTSNVGLSLNVIVAMRARASPEM